MILKFSTPGKILACDLMLYNVYIKLICKGKPRFIEGFFIFVEKCTKMLKRYIMVQQSLKHCDTEILLNFFKLYLSNTIFFVWLNSPACIVYKYNPTDTGSFLSLVAFHWTDLNPEF